MRLRFGRITTIRFRRRRPTPPTGPWRGTAVDRVVRLHLTYFWCHRRTLSLDRPSRLTELIQRRKLIDRDPRFPTLIDKLEAKRLVADRLGAQWITPTLWSGVALPDLPPWPVPFVVKWRHGCNQCRFVRDVDEDWAGVRRASARWMRSSYGGWLDEWGYRDVPRGLLVEPFVGHGATLPVDYKLFVFHGRVAYVQVHLDREHRHRWLVFDRDWCRVSRSTADRDPARPRSLDRMIAGAELLGRDFDFVRIDFYELGGSPRFGEMTFYPGSGLEPVEPPELDAVMGALWLRRTAAAARPG